MGEGGFLALVNGTGYDWHKRDFHGYQLDHWAEGFPDVIPAGTTAVVYAEFKRGIGIKEKDTNGHCNYSVDGDRSIRIEISDKPEEINVQLVNISTPGNPSGSKIQCGWIHDGTVSFVLSGKGNRMNSSNPPRDWMQANLGTLGSRPLHQICIPGSHDAGMGEVNVDPVMKLVQEIFAALTQTQSDSILHQLQAGSRYFDIRAVKSGGQFWTGHYAMGGSKMGARGQKISQVIDNVNEFTRDNAELIIINLSHSYNLDDGYRPFNHDEHRALHEELKRLDHRFVVHGDQVNDISRLPLSHFIGNRRAAVMLVCEEMPNKDELGGFSNEGFYLRDQLNVYNEYADKNDTALMISDQIGKMEKYMSANDKHIFLLSWTLTQQAPKFDLGNPVVAIGQMRDWQNRNKLSIRHLASSANKALFTDLLPRVRREAFPNIVYMDFLDHQNYAALAMAINDKAFMHEL